MPPALQANIRIHSRDRIPSRIPSRRCGTGLILRREPGHAASSPEDQWPTVRGLVYAIPPDLDRALPADLHATMPVVVRRGRLRRAVADGRPSAMLLL